MLRRLFRRAGVTNYAAAGNGAGAVPDTVRYSFDLGAVVMLAAIGWTVIRTREYPPDMLRSFEDAAPVLPAPPPERRQRFSGVAWGLAGLGGLILTRLAGLDRELYL